MKQNKVFSLLGIAMRGHNLVSGELQTLEAIKKGSAMLVIIAEDASENTKKLFPLSRMQRRRVRRLLFPITSCRLPSVRKDRMQDWQQD